MTGEVRYAAWLMLHPGQEQRFQRLLGALASRYDGEPFPPHLTITSGIRGEVSRVTRRCRQIGRHVPVMRLTCGPVTWADERFRAVYLPVPRCRPLLDLRWQIRRAFGLPPATFLPHMSLLYARPHALALAAVAAGLAERGWPTLLGNRLQIWRITDDPIEWEPVAEQKLAGC